MDLQALSENFAIPDVLRFEQNDAGLIRAIVTTRSASAEIYLQGAHLTHWQPTGTDPVLFLSSKSDFEPGKPIRGGIPVIFPWFGPHSFGQVPEGIKPPSHGFARIEPWTLAFAAQAGDAVHLTFTLAPTRLSEQYGYASFRLAYTLVIGSSLSLSLTAANPPDATGPIVFEEALHTYFSVADIGEVTVDGLAGTSYIDKVDGGAVKQQPGTSIRFTTEDRTPLEVDRPYLDTAATCILRDPVCKRIVTVHKSDSLTTVVWNPSPSKPLPDLDTDEWQRFVCIETANAATNRIELAPGVTHTMRASYAVS